jgi:hypothetical protein
MEHFKCTVHKYWYFIRWLVIVIERFAVYTITCITNILNHIWIYKQCKMQQQSSNPYTQKSLEIKIFTTLLDENWRDEFWWQTSNVMIASSVKQFLKRGEKKQNYPILFTHYFSCHTNGENEFHQWNKSISSLPPPISSEWFHFNVNVLCRIASVGYTIKESVTLHGRPIQNSGSCTPTTKSSCYALKHLQLKAKSLFSQ